MKREDPARQLLKAIRAKDARTRADAARSLGEIGDVRAAESLLSALRDPEALVRQRAASALGKIGDVRAVEPLLLALSDQYSGVQKEAAYALGQIGDPRAIEPLLGMRDQEAQWALVHLARRDMSPLLASLAAQDEHVWQRAIGTLGELGTQAVAPALEALAHPDGRVRAGGARVLGMVGDVGDVGRVEPLLAALQDPEPGVRAGAATALGKIADPRAITPLVAALDDDDESVRLSADLAFRGHFPLSNLEQTVEQLLGVLTSGSRVARASAASALWRVVNKSCTYAVEPLLAALQDEEPQVRKGAAAVLGKVGDARAVEPLLAALQDKAAVVRAEAAGALGAVGDARAVEALLALLADEDKDVLLSVVRALGELESVEAIQPLQALRGTFYLDHFARSVVEDALHKIHSTSEWR
jgi:HEAT repeat protein